MREKRIEPCNHRRCDGTTATVCGELSSSVTSPQHLSLVSENNHDTGHFHCGRGTNPSSNTPPLPPPPTTATAATTSTSTSKSKFRPRNDESSENEYPRQDREHYNRTIVSRIMRQLNRLRQISPFTLSPGVGWSRVIGMSCVVILWSIAITNGNSRNLMMNNTIIFKIPSALVAIVFVFVCLVFQKKEQRTNSNMRVQWSRIGFAERLQKLIGNHRSLRQIKYNHEEASTTKRHTGPLEQLKRVASGSTFTKTLASLSPSAAASCSFKATLQAITHKQMCFVRTDYIERLSINDVGMLFRYAINMSGLGHDQVNSSNNTQHPIFDRNAFRNDQSEVVQSVITAIDMAVRISRGGLKDPVTRESSGTDSHTIDLGDIDSLYFVACCRIFSEWRAVRLVPDGYQRYAVALGLGYRDMLQNLEKIERGVGSYYRYRQSQYQQLYGGGCVPTIPSPTIRELLNFESTTNVHVNLPYLAEKSAASGLLWAKRQLLYQVATLSNSLQVPSEKFPSAKDAAQAAYRQVYQDYHGWAVKQIFSHSLNGSPPLDKIWKVMEPPDDMPRDRKSMSSNGQISQTQQMNGVTSNNAYSRQTQQAGRDPSCSQSRPSYSTSSEVYDMPERQLSDVTDHSQRSVEESTKGIKYDVNVDNQFLSALGKVFVEKWEDILRLFNCGKKSEKLRNNEHLILSCDSHFNLNQLAQLESLDRSDNDLLVPTSTGLEKLSLPASQSEMTTLRSQTNNQDSQTSLLRHDLDSHADDVVRKSKQDTADFISELSPLLADLSQLFDAYNMKDPTRV